MRTITLLLTLALVSIQAFPQVGALDASFSGDGIAIFNPTANHETANDLVILPDSSVIICGSAIFSGGFSFDGFLMRILPDGSQDMSFGTNGIVQIDYGPETYAYSLDVQPDGKIVVSGMTYPVYPNSEFFIARFNPNGTLDATFNSTGYFISAYGPDEEYCQAMVMQPDGKFILAGRTYAGAFSQLLFTRVNANGTLDASFGSNGFTEIDASIQDEEISALTLLNNGQIIGVGYGFQGDPLWAEQLFMVKLDANGQPSAGFGTNGVMVPAIFNDVSSGSGVIAHNDSIYITGNMWDVNNNIMMFLAKLDPNGNAYNSFGTNGITFFNLNVANYGLDLLKTEDNKIYVSGTTGLGGTGNRDFLIARFLPSGDYDNTFNTTGYTITPIQPDWDEAAALGIAPNGKVVLAGMTSGFSTTGNNDIAMTRYLNDYLPSGLYANFTSDEVLICEGDLISFTDLSISVDSVVLSWNWTFEGGTPATSTQQNPTVTYNSDGDFNVRLIVYDGIYYDTLLRENYIVVEAIPAQPSTPTGPSELCGGYDGVYSISGVTYADSYDWQVTPVAAGTMSGTGTTATFTASANWTGMCDIRVRAVNQCGNGPWSASVQCAVYHNPVLFQLLGDGGFCEGSPGFEMVLDGSESDVSYELYFNGNPTGNVIPGTGSAISFGDISTVGLYTVSGYTDHCFEYMVGQIYVHQLALPAQATTPNGPPTVCDQDASTYITLVDPDADVYFWTLSPEEAGAMTVVFDTAHVVWTAGWTGKAHLSVHAENACGAGPESEALEINVYLDPEPVISGPQQVCDNTPEVYETADNPGSFYTWETTGGIITAGPGTHQVTVLWGEPGAGTLIFTEETADGCVAATEAYVVTIDDCTFIRELSKERLNIYPNPATDLLNIGFRGYLIGAKSELLVTNSFGQKLFWSGIQEGSEHVTISTAGYPSGIYFINLIENGHTVASARFTVMR